MKPSSNLFATLAILLLALAAAAQTYPASSDSETQLGVEAYKESQYDEAIQHFEKAVELDGSNLKARFYMGTARVLIGLAVLASGRRSSRRKGKVLRPIPGRRAAA